MPGEAKKVIGSPGVLKPRRHINSTYTGKHERRYSQELGMSTNARVRDNQKVRSMGRPDKLRSTATNRLPRLAPLDQTQAGDGPKCKNQAKKGRKGQTMRREEEGSALQQQPKQRPKKMTLWQRLGRMGPKSKRTRERKRLSIEPTGVP